MRAAKFLSLHVQRSTSMKDVARQTDSGESTIRSFHVSIPDSELAEMRHRVSATRCPDPETVTDKSQGVKLAMIQG